LLLIAEPRACAAPTTIQCATAPASLRSEAVDDRSVGELLRGAAAGDERCWRGLVDRYARLVWAVAAGFNLDRAAMEDVSQTVWLRLAENLHRIREPARLPGWLQTTTRNEALRVARGQQRVQPTDAMADSAAPTTPVDEPVLAAETLAEVLEAFRGLDPATQELLRLLCVVPPLDYRTISEMTGRPIGSIGPTRQRCLEKLRKLLPPEVADGGNLR
jgi:RNA polymerase sigma factor (sigma-70 family)